LWKHKASHCFYEVFNDFVSVFKVLLLGEDAPRISDQATKFLDRKGALEQMDNYSVIRIFGSKEKPCSPSMSHYRQNVCYRNNKAIQLLVASIP
jgi:hypothetical protein